jgi:hypothetical protein
MCRCGSKQKGRQQPTFFVIERQPAVAPLGHGHPSFLRAALNQLGESDGLTSGHAEAVFVAPAHLVSSADIVFV